MRKIYILVLISMAFICSLAFAETIRLKSGKEYEGKIVERTDKYIKIDIGIGMPITYFLDEIERVEREEILSSEGAGQSNLLKETAPAQSKSTNSNTYRNEEYGISITGPDGWYKTLGEELLRDAVTAQVDFLVVFSKLPVGTIAEKNPNINLVVEPQNFPINSAIEYLEYCQSSFEKTLLNYRLVSPITEVNINGVVGASQEHTAGFGQRVITYSFMTDKYIFTVTAVTREDIFEENRKIFKDSIESFRFINK